MMNKNNKKRKPVSCNLTGFLLSDLQEVHVTTHILRISGNFATCLPRHFSQLRPAHVPPHPLKSNGTITTSSRAIWPARAARPRLVAGLFV